jgi:hypothetical protein
VILFLLTLLNPNPGHVNMLASGVAVFIFFNAWKERQMLANESSNTEFWESRPGVAWNHPYRTLEKEGRAASRGFFGRWRKGSAARRRQAVTNPDEYMRDVVNPILDKIAREGMQSLTRRERQILESAREMIGKKGR